MAKPSQARNAEARRQNKAAHGKITKRTSGSGRERNIGVTDEHSRVAKGQQSGH